MCHQNKNVNVKSQTIQIYLSIAPPEMIAIDFIRTALHSEFDKVFSNNIIKERINLLIMLTSFNSGYSRIDNQ